MKKSCWKWIAAAIGAAGGFAYWKFIGCESGTCPIQSTWYISTLFGFVLGWLIGRMVSGESGCSCNSGTSSTSSCGCGSGSSPKASDGANNSTPKSGCGCGCK